MQDHIHAARIVAITARQHATAVDRDSRFPVEAISELKRYRLLSIANNFDIDKHVVLPQILHICTVLAGACPATAMIFAMHTLCVMQVSNHGSRWHKSFLEDLQSGQYLIASATSEVAVGGATAESICARVEANGKFSIHKDATVVSYGLEADAILVTARREKNAARNQQILALCLKQDCTLALRNRWDSLGMRGTCSHALDLTLAGANEQIFEEPFGKILELTGLPTAHLLWGHVWAGIATEAYNKARSYLRHRRTREGAGDRTERKLFECMSRLTALYSILSGALQQYLTSDYNDAEARNTVMVMNALKVRASEEATAIVQGAMDICGLHGYMNGGDFTVAQSLRDVFANCKCLMREAERLSDRHTL